MPTTIEKTTTVNLEKNIVIAYVLWFFLGVFGIHRFYANKIGSGVVMLSLTLLAAVLAVTVVGLILAIPMWIALGLWWIIDAFLILRWNLNLVSNITTTTTTTTE